LEEAAGGIRTRDRRLSRQ